MDKTIVALFEGNKIRKLWNEKDEKWYFSVVDIVGVLSNSTDSRNYWKVLKSRLNDEGSELVTKCNQLKMKASDGKFYLTDTADTETLFRLIQSIPSPNAEPFKLWLARVGYERVEETIDPELAINRALQTYLKKGYSLDWVNQRLKTIEIRKGLTNEWDKRGVKKGLEYAILTDEITFAWAGISTRNYKSYKGLKKENLRDNMTNLELVLTMLAEASTIAISEKVEPKDFEDNKKVAREGGNVAGVARKKLEEKIGKSVLSNNKHIIDNPKKLNNS